MRRLPFPQLTVGTALQLCVASIRDVDLKARLEAAAADMKLAENNYINQGNHAEFHTIAGSLAIGNNVSLAEMERVYNGTFVRSARTRHIYDQLKSAPDNDICPLCGQRTVSTLDHYLPESRHPALAITPANLVPACSECNKDKLHYQATHAGEQTFHPYFDDANTDRWLFASVREVFPATLVYSLNPLADWSDTAKARLSTHFSKFKLARLYASHAAVEVGNLRFGLRAMAQRNTPEQLSEHLRLCASSCMDVYRNSWQGAAYEALADSAWYCSGGFES